MATRDDIAELRAEIVWIRRSPLRRLGASVFSGWGSRREAVSNGRMK